MSGATTRRILAASPEDRTEGKIRSTRYRGALAALGALTLLAGCTEEVPYGGPGTVVSETPNEADTVLSCQSLGAERLAISGTLERLAAQPGSADEVSRLRTRQSALADLAASKHCPGS